MNEVTIDRAEEIRRVMQLEVSFRNCPPHLLYQNRLDSQLQVANLAELITLAFFNQLNDSFLEAVLKHFPQLLTDSKN